MNIAAELILLAKTCAVALAVGLDVFAICIGIGVARLPRSAGLRLGLIFTGFELAMQAIGYTLGEGAGLLLGSIAAYAGFSLLAIIGLLMLHAARHEKSGTRFDPTKGPALIMTALSVSLDSLGVGLALPGVSIELIPLLITLSISTTLFTLLGLHFGARLGERYETRAEFLAGALLIVLAIAFSLERLYSIGLS